MRSNEDATATRDMPHAHKLKYFIVSGFAPNSFMISTLAKPLLHERKSNYAIGIRVHGKA